MKWFVYNSLHANYLKMSFTQEEQQIFQMRCIHHQDNDTIASITNKNILEVNSLITGLINKMKKKMMPDWLIAQNLNMRVEEIDLYKEDTRQNTTIDQELYKRICELELNAACHKHTEEQLRMRVAQLEEQLDYRLARIEERVKLYSQHNTCSGQHKSSAVSWLQDYEVSNDFVATEN